MRRIERSGCCETGDHHGRNAHSMLADLVAADRGRRRMKRTPLSSVNCGKRNCIALAPECSASQLGAAAGRGRYSPAWGPCARHSSRVFGSAHDQPFQPLGTPVSGRIQQSASGPLDVQVIMVPGESRPSPQPTYFSATPPGSVGRRPTIARHPSFAMHSACGNPKQSGLAMHAQPPSTHSCPHCGLGHAGNVHAGASDTVASRAMHTPLFHAHAAFCEHALWSSSSHWSVT